MLLFHLLIILLVSASISKSSANINYETEIEIKYQKLCSSIPGCICTNHKQFLSTYTLSCYHDDSKDDVEIEITNSEILEIIFIHCKDVSSFKLIPDLTDHNENLKIKLINCMVPKNESINQLTRKISKNIKSLMIEFNKNVRNLNLDKNYFEGLPSLEYLEIEVKKTNIMNISANSFENLSHLKYLMLDVLPLPNGIFDTLENLQYLKISSETGNYFKNQRNLVELHLKCLMQCSFDSFIFENLTNLEILKIKNYQIPRLMLANLRNLKYVHIKSSDFGTISKDIFINSTNIEEISLVRNNLISLPKDMFKDQTMLVQLILIDNQLVELVDGTFDKTVNMEILILSQNKLTSISRYVIIITKYFTTS